jgi:hypothetical protein
MRTGSSIPILNTNDTNSLNNRIRGSSSVNFYSSCVVNYILKRYRIDNPLLKLQIEDLLRVVNEILPDDV